MFYKAIESMVGPDYTFIKGKPKELCAVRVQFERDLVLYAWRRARGNQVQASKIFGTNRNTFRKLKLKHGITLEDIPPHMLDRIPPRKS